MSPRAEERIIETTDLTPIQNATEDVESWLREVARRANATSLALRLSPRDNENDEPVVFYDERTARWWAGRYIGEIRYQGRTLRIMPRFGMPQLQRWLSRIWGIRLLATKGRYEASRVWLWELLARLWESRLLPAAKHGLPTVRLDELHRGESIRGRLQVRLTAKAFSLGQKVLVSRTRNRHIDPRIGGVILHAFEHLRRELRHLGDERSWLTQRGQDLIGRLRTHLTRQDGLAAVESRVPIRYTPITEGYRPIVELSQAIARQRPFSPESEGSEDVLGVLIDMAEVWELYVFHLLRSALRGVDVLHTGRRLDIENYLLHSNHTRRRLGGLKPDILIHAFNSDWPLVILDAKYKTTAPSADRPLGVLREDLYQMAAYLGSYGPPAEALAGGLVYPATLDTQHILELQAASPWRIPAAARQLWFFGLSCQLANSSVPGLTPGEQAFINSVQLVVARGTDLVAVADKAR